jgi:hypothetical protein
VNDHPRRLLGFDDETENYGHDGTVSNLDDGEENLYKFAGSQRDTLHTDDQSSARLGQVTGTLSGIIRNYHDPDVGAAAHLSNEELRNSSSLAREAIPLLSRSDSQHAAEYFRVHGRYPPNIYDASNSDLHGTPRVLSRMSGEELMEGSLESNPVLRGSEQGTRLTSKEEQGSPIARSGLTRPTLFLNTQPSAAPNWAPPVTPDRPQPLFTRPVDSSVSFSNPGLSYTSTNQLLTTASPPRRFDQPPSTNWPILASQPFPSMEEPRDTSSPNVGRGAAYIYQDVSEMYPEDDRRTVPENSMPPIPTIWNRQSSGPLHRHSYNSADESVADMSDDDPAQPRYATSRNMIEGDNRYSGTDWETIPNETSRAGSVPELPGGINHSAGSRPFREYADRLRHGASRIHAPPLFIPSHEQVRDYHSYSPYAMDENWDSTYLSRGPPFNTQGGEQHHQNVYRQQPALVADEDLSPDPNDDFEYIRNSFAHGAFQQPSEAHRVLHRRDSDLSYHYPTEYEPGGYLPSHDNRMHQQASVDSLPGPLAQIIPMPAQTYNPQRPRTSTLSRSEAPTSSYNDSQRQFPHHLSLDPLISDNVAGPNAFEMSAIRGDRRYYRMSSLQPTSRRAVNWQTEPQQLHLSPSNGRQSAATDTTTWGGLMNKLALAASRDSTFPPGRHVPKTPGVTARPATLYRQESGTALLPRQYRTDVEKQLSGHDQTPSDGNTFSVVVLIISTVFIILLPLYSYGKLDVAIQWYTKGSKQTYAKKFKTTALLIFAVEVTGISVAAIMGGVMSKN